MDFVDFLRGMLGITDDFAITSIVKDEENRTEEQQRAFEQMLSENLLTSKAWQIRENFKYLFGLKDCLSINYEL